MLMTATERIQTNRGGVRLTGLERRAIAARLAELDRLKERKGSEPTLVHCLICEQSHDPSGHACEGAKVYENTPAVSGFDQWPIETGPQLGRGLQPAWNFRLEARHPEVATDPEGRALVKIGKPFSRELSPFEEA